MVKSDPKELIKLRGLTRQFIKETEAAANIKQIRERSRQRRLTEKKRAEVRAKERIVSEQARRETLEKRAQLQARLIKERQIQRLQTAQDLASLRRRYGIERQVETAAISQGYSTTKPFIHTLFVALGIFFGAIILYILVQNPQGTTNWLNSLSVAVATLSQSTPLFVKETNA